MGGADGAGTATATAAVDQFNFRRTPINSGDVTESSNQGYWLQKEAEYNSLDPRSQNQLSSTAEMPPMSLLENDWNHLREISIPGLEGTPFKQLIPVYPKLLDIDGVVLASGPQDFVSIRRIFGNPSAGAFMNGPVFADTRIEGPIFNDFMIQQGRVPIVGNIRDGVLYKSAQDARQSSQIIGLEHFIPPGLQQDLSEQLLRDLAQLRVSGFDGRSSAGQFVVPANAHEPQMNVVGRTVVNNNQNQAPAQSRWAHRFHHNNNTGNRYNNHDHHRGNHHQQSNNNSCQHARQGGFVNNRFNRGGRLHFDQRFRVNGGAYETARPVTRSTTPVPTTSASPATQENRREQLVPIQVVVVDRPNEVRPSFERSVDNSGEYTSTDGYRAWQRKRHNHGLPDSTPNKIYFNRNL